MKLSRIHILSVPFLALMLMVSCCSSKTTKNNDGEKLAMDGNVKLADLDSTIATDSLIVLEGKYMGVYGKGCDMVEGSRQRTRSDWVFSDGEKCIYVSGGGPENLRPMKDKNVEITLRAHYKNHNGVVYLEYIGSKQINTKQGQ